MSVEMSDLLDLVVAFLELRSLQPELPAEFKEVYDEEKYRTSQEYTRVTTRFSLIQNTVTFLQLDSNLTM